MVICLILWAGAEFAYVHVEKEFDSINRLIFSGAVPALMDLRSLKSGTVTALRETIDSGFRDVVGCVFVAAMLRIILVGKVGLNGADSGRLGRAVGGILFVSFAVTVALNAPFLLVNGFVDIDWQDDWSGLIKIGAPLVFIVAIVYLTARLCLIYPSVAIGQGLDLVRNWRRTAGNGIRMAAVFAMVFFAVGAVETLLDVFALGVAFTAVGSAWFAPALVAKEVVLSVLTGAVVLALSAVAFTRLAGYPAAGVPGASKSPQQLAGAFD